MAFLFPSIKAAARLRGFPADTELDQVIVAFETAALVEAGCDVRFCRWNNGFPDRQRPPRLRSASDYRPIAEWRRGDVVAEVVATEPVPADVPFQVVST